MNYQLPHKNILELADSELAPVMKMDADGKRALLLYRVIFKSIEELALEEMKLAGLRTNVVNNISAREPYYKKITILDVDESKEYDIKGLPENAKWCKVSWNYTNTKSLAINILEDHLELWCIDLTIKSAHKIYAGKLNCNLGSPFIWLKDDSILINLVPENLRPYKNQKTEKPSGPNVAENDGQSVETRTFQDLLKNKIDEYNFENIVTSEIWHLKLNGELKIWKQSAMHDGLSLSPDGNYIMLSEIKKPFSYFVQFDRFPYSTYIFNIHGDLLHTVVESPAIEYLPQGFMAVQKGIRSIRWRGDKPSTLVWIEAQDEGNPDIEVEYRDFVYQQEFPIYENPKIIFKTKDRFAGLFFGKDDLALIYENWWATRNLKTILFNPNNIEEAILFDERNYQNIYADPGNFINSKNEFGWNTLLIEEDGSMYLNADGHSPTGRKPYIDRYNYKTKVKERIFTSNEVNRQEDIVFVFDPQKGDIVTLIQSKIDYPNFYKRNIYTGEISLIRHFENPFKAIQNVHKEIIKYYRKDGVELNANLYLPVGYTKDTASNLPLIIWAYPTEYKNKETASQKTQSENDFIYPHWSSPLYWLNRGYVILDNASFPIIGEEDAHPNDTYINQLIANAEAAIDAVSAYIDRSKIAVGGHSYGAFMVSMLLTHTSLFAAGIARSGAYNRTLTPFGFQSEERNYWQAKDTYNAMNPFIDADKMKTPLLLIHGEADNNSGTYTMQTERYYAALKALGATVRMVLLPFESHSYMAKESIMHVLWEQDKWLEKWVKKTEGA